MHLREYIRLRDKFTPKDLKLIFVLESPPAGPAYFYNPAGKTSELLFRAFMALLNIKPATKEEGLQYFMKQGWLIIDPIYEPVNKLPDKVADELILQNYPNFKKDLSQFASKETPLILVKANVLKLLENKLIEDGFNVINNKLAIPFPMHFHQREFVSRIKLLLKNTV
jgi:hypothetical protein